MSPIRRLNGHELRPNGGQNLAVHVFNQARLNNDERVLVGLKHNISYFT